MAMPTSLLSNANSELDLGQTPKLSQSNDEIDLSSVQSPQTQTPLEKSNDEIETPKGFFPWLKQGIEELKNMPAENQKFIQSLPPEQRGMVEAEAGPLGIIQQKLGEEKEKTKSILGKNIAGAGEAIAGALNFPNMAGMAAHPIETTKQTFKDVGTALGETSAVPVTAAMGHTEIPEFVKKGDMASTAMEAGMLAGATEGMMNLTKEMKLTGKVPSVADVVQKTGTEIMEKTGDVRQSAAAAQKVLPTPEEMAEFRRKDAAAAGLNLKAMDQEAKNEDVLSNENEAYLKAVASDPAYNADILPKTSDGEVVHDLKKHDLINLTQLQKVSLAKDLTTKRLMKDAPAVAKMATADTMTLMGRTIPMALVRNEINVVPRQIRIMWEKTGMADVEKAARSLTKDEMADITLSVEHMKFDDSGNVVRSDTIKNELREKNPVYKQCIDGIDKFYAEFRKEGAPMIAGGEELGPGEVNRYLFHAFDYKDARTGKAGNLLNDIRNGRDPVNTDQLEAASFLPAFKMMRKGAPGWDMNFVKAGKLYAKLFYKEKTTMATLARTDAMAESLFKNQPVRMAYYRTLRDSALGKPYSIDVKIAPLVKTLDRFTVGQYIVNLALNLSTAFVKHPLPIALMAMEDSLHTLRAIPKVAGETARVIWHLDPKESPVLRNPMIYNNVRKFYDVASDGAAMIPGMPKWAAKAGHAINSALMSPLAFSEFIKRGIGFHTGLMRELERQSKDGEAPSMRKAYDAGVSYAMDHGLPLAHLLRQENLRDTLPRSVMQFKWPGIATLNLLYREARENPKGFAGIMAGVGTIIAFQRLNNQCDFLADNFGQKKNDDANWDMFSKLSPLNTAIDEFKPDISEDERSVLFNQLNMAKTGASRAAVMEKFGMTALQFAGLPITSRFISKIGTRQGPHAEDLVPVGMRDAAKFIELINNSDIDSSALEIFLELTKVKTRPRYWSQ